eukprot:CAMPEP_0168479058 /NCGR_PEP_ID=MMETSP0228-20121227/63274_1 /TAXON_ID=133427 /ORGANISM="Protoceratium reticulatum, Strain CCCM 535 (=CCMP 1889)" /LENGTH=145 /DNA_ID=CAMNT_0008495331 /DNA_START=1 /DNA_END=434 /DNA_ORIENTATION=-
MLVRHGQGAHNVRKDYSIPDPALTAKGLRQAEDLRGAVELAGAELVVVSPLTRALQTARAVWGERPPLPVLVTALHSERVDEPCDRGRTKSELEAQFPFLRSWGGWDELPEHWSLTKEQDKNWKRERVPAFLQWLRDRPESRIAV